MAAAPTLPTSALAPPNALVATVFCDGLLDYTSAVHRVCLRALTHAVRGLDALVPAHPLAAFAPFLHCVEEGPPGGDPTPLLYLVREKRARECADMIRDFSFPPGVIIPYCEDAADEGLRASMRYAHRGPLLIGKAEDADPMANIVTRDPRGPCAAYLFDARRSGVVVEGKGRSVVVTFGNPVAAMRDAAARRLIAEDPPSSAKLAGFSHRLGA